MNNEINFVEKIKKIEELKKEGNEEEEMKLINELIKEYPKEHLGYYKKSEKLLQKKQYNKSIETIIEYNNNNEGIENPELSKLYDKATEEVEMLPKDEPESIINDLFKIRNISFHQLNMMVSDFEEVLVNEGEKIKYEEKFVFLREIILLILKICEDYKKSLLKSLENDLFDHFDKYFSIYKIKLDENELSSLILKNILNKPAVIDDNSRYFSNFSIIKKK
jgi:hypothetical protein